MLDKASSDDELLDALRDELKRTQALLAAEREERQAAAAAVVPRVVRLNEDGRGKASNKSAVSNGNEDSNAELTRLRRLCAQQVNIRRRI